MLKLPVADEDGGAVADARGRETLLQLPHSAPHRQRLPLQAIRGHTSGEQTNDLENSHQTSHLQPSERHGCSRERLL